MNKTIDNVIDEISELAKCGTLPMVRYTMLVKRIKADTSVQSDIMSFSESMKQTDVVDLILSTY